MTKYVLGSYHDVHQKMLDADAIIASGSDKYSRTPGISIQTLLNITVAP